MTEAHPYPNLLPGKLWQAKRSFIGIDIKLQEQHELSQKYYGKEKEILLVLNVEPANLFTMSEEQRNDVLIRVLGLVGTKLVLIPWYTPKTWGHFFSIIQ